MPGLTASWTDFDLYQSCNVTATQRLLEAIRRSAPRLRRLNTRAADFFDKESAESQRLVAQLLGIETIARAARQQAIGGVFRHAFGRQARRLAVGGRGHEPFHHQFDVPAVIHELHRKPVEQLRMARRFAL